MFTYRRCVSQSWMPHRRARCLLIAVLPLLASCFEGGRSCAGFAQSGYRFPQRDANNKTVKHAAQVFISEQGINNIAHELPPTLTRGCTSSEENVSEAKCSFDPADPQVLTVYLGKPDKPFHFAANAPMMGQIDVTLRSENDHPFGRSRVSFDTASLAHMLHVQLVNDGPHGRLHVSLECNNAPCSEDDVQVSIDAVAVVKMGRKSAACYIRGSREEGTGIGLTSLDFDVAPRIERDSEGIPHFAMRAEDAVVSNFHINTALEISTSPNDEACVGDGCESVCYLLNTANQAGFFKSKIKEMVSTKLVETLLKKIAEKPLMMSKGLALPQYLRSDSAGEPSAVLGYMGTPNDASPRVLTLEDGRGRPQTGLFIEADLLTNVQHHACVPSTVAPRDFSREIHVPQFPKQAMLPDVTTRALVATPYDVGMMVGQHAIEALLDGMFQSGNLCVSVSSDNVGQRVLLGHLADFVPSLSQFGSPQTPVRVALVPTEAMNVELSDPQTTGRIAKVSWQRVGLHLFAGDVGHETAIGSWTTDIAFGIDLRSNQTGGAKLYLSEFSVAADAPNASFADQGMRVMAEQSTNVVRHMLESVVPQFVTGDGTLFEVKPTSLGLNFRPKFLGAQRIVNTSALAHAVSSVGFFFAVCNAEELNDSDNLQCYQGTTN